MQRGLVQAAIPRGGNRAVWVASSRYNIPTILLAFRCLPWCCCKSNNFKTEGMSNSSCLSANSPVAKTPKVCPTPSYCSRGTLSEPQTYWLWSSSKSFCRWKCDRVYGMIYSAICGLWTPLELVIAISVSFQIGVE